MIQRSEVEAMLERATGRYASHEWLLDADVMAELCRTWLAVQDAYVGEVDYMLEGEVDGDAVIRLPKASITQHPIVTSLGWQLGQCVRLVADTGNDNGT